MHMLPAALIVLTLLSSTWAARTSTNDPFRAISTQVVREAEEPVCCLIPLDDPPEVPEDDVLLSFEQWKDKQASASNRSGSTTTTIRMNATGAADSTAGEAPSVALQESPETQAIEQLSPHFQVPLTDRFNYASLDCSARVHLSHRTAKSPSSILSSKRDRYMLSPCNSKDEQFVVVELCDDIRIDTVQLANFEFFSGVFKDFTVSVAKTYTTLEEGWTVVETYRADNVRGVQSFHPPTSIRDFYRYIRIQFHSHYSNEYYCPVSLLRVYGLTHLEQWKWDIWESEYRARNEESHAAEEPEPAQTPQVIVVERHVSTPDIEEDVPGAFTPLVLYGPSTYDPSWQDASGTLTTTTFTTDSAPVKEHDDPYENRHSTDIYSDDLASSIREETPSTSTSSTATSSSSQSKVVNSTSSSASPSGVSASSSASKSASVTLSPTMSPPPMPPSSGGESIYRTIMNRLTALEGNHTLYVRYVEEQTNGVRELIRRLGEDVGRLEGIGKAQTQTYQRRLREWEKQRRRIEMDYRELSHRVAHLSDEIILEKRLGIAQLCLLLAVLLFMGLTRGSRNDSMDHVPIMLKKGMREWSRRHLSFRGDWFSSRSRERAEATQRSPKPAPFKLNEPPFKRSPPQHNGQLSLNDDVKLEFPPSARVTSPKVQPISKPLTYGAEQRPRKQSDDTRSRSHTPNPIRKPLILHRPTTPTSRPQLVRSNSGTGHVLLTGQKSVRRWARTAHLHEVRSAKRKLDDADPFLSPTKKEEGYAAHCDPWLSRGGRGECDEGEWMDTDGSEVEEL
ncbi:hypothetical protein BDZ89DRAFT_1073417 [Hymenopellis radicata]|nr:hypothetical protein BDZ89DRAFT_1073417 [Hymenopellis radicata]